MFLFIIPTIDTTLQSSSRNNPELLTRQRRVFIADPHFPPSPSAVHMMEAIRKGKPILVAEPDKNYFIGTGRSKHVKIGCQAVNAIQINFICNDKHVGPNEIKTIEVEDEKTGLRVMEVSHSTVKQWPFLSPVFFFNLTL